MPLETPVSHTSPSSGREKQTVTLRRSTLSFLEPLKKCTETGFEVSMKEWKVWRCSPRAASYCCDISEAQRMYSTDHDAGGY